MTKRIDVTPNSDGTIILICGDEELVLTLKDYPKPVFIPTRIGHTVSTHRLHTFSIPTVFDIGHVDGIVEDIFRGHTDPDTPDVHEVMLQGPQLDVHKVAKLADRLHDVLPAVGLHVNLKDDLL
jgi:hypothetical protein